MATPITKIESFQYPAAHFAHLSEAQQKALERFKVICQERGYYTPQPDDGTRHASHDDETLLRFLRARTFDPEGAFKQFSETEEWRKENRLEDYYDVIDVEEFEATRVLYPQWTGRRDKRGMPVFVFEVVSLDSKTINKYQDSLKHDKSPPLNPKSKTEPKWLRLFSLYESLTRFVLPLCSAIENRPHPETPVSQSNNIVDISSVGLRQFWNLKTHMQDASTLATAHYPETLDRIFIIGAPNFFPTVWGWVKRWFDPITVSKIFILSQPETFPTLSKYIDIENIPKKYGGKLDFAWGDRPNLDPAIQAALDWNVPGSDGKPPTSIPRGPNRWRELPNGTIEAIAVGKVDGQKRTEIWGRTSHKLAYLHGVERHVSNTPIDWSKEEYQTTTGTSTQTKVDGATTTESFVPTEATIQEDTAETPVASKAVVTEDPVKPTESETPVVAAPVEAKQPETTVQNVTTPTTDNAGVDVVTEKISMMPIRTASDRPVPTLLAAKPVVDPEAKPVLVPKPVQ